VPITYATADTFRCATVEQLRPILAGLTTITWPCPAEAIPAIIDRLGWALTSSRVHVKADVGLPLNWAVGDFSRPDGQFTQLGFPVSDVVATDDAPAASAVKAAFPLMVDGIEAVLGPADGRIDDLVHQTWWELPSEGRIKLELLPGNLQMRLLSKQVADVERFVETHDMSQYHDDE